MMKHIVAAAVLIGSLTSAEAANSHVIGGWQGLTFSLQDLDPTDAFAPSLTAVQYTNCFGTTSPGCFSIRPPPGLPVACQFRGY